MPRFDAARVAQILSERNGLQRLLLDDGTRAYALSEVVGSASEGDLVIVNTTAVDLDLGTGGWHVVHWIDGNDGNYTSSIFYIWFRTEARYVDSETL